MSDAGEWNGSWSEPSEAFIGQEYIPETCARTRRGWRKGEGAEKKKRKKGKGKKRLTATIAWAEQGIVGRGVLVDYHSWRTSPEGQAQSKVKDYDSFESVSIPVSDLEACLKAQGTELKFGDILFIRSGKRTIPSGLHPSLSAPASQLNLAKK